MPKTCYLTCYLLTGLVVTAICASNVAAFDTARAEVTDAYVGELTPGKRQTALEGVNELLDVLTELSFEIGVNGSFQTDASRLGDTIFSVAPGVTVLTTISAGADGDLAGFGDPVLLDDTLLDVTANFTSARGITVGPGGA
jgi:hypothetical protein